MKSCPCCKRALADNARHCPARGHFFGSATNTLAKGVGLYLIIPFPFVFFVLIALAEKGGRV